MISAEQHKRLKEVVEGALDHPLDERTSYVAQQCQGDAALLSEAKALLEAYSDEDPSAEAERIGPYRLIREIGSGGMGVVYLAEREGGYHRKVAMKVMRRGMDTDFFLARFLKEREILGALDHPGVVRIVDAGSTLDGRPFLVMDYVDGMRIDKYCDYHKLPTLDRVRLFIKVCSAVQHAHRNLIVHRDLKPSNILVTPEGEPKLLDFGIAKVVDENDERTQLTIPIMTRQYASPEQVKGKRITTSCDVYALGLIFYEMLTGRRPYDLRDRPVTEVERLVCEVEPPQPSAASVEQSSRGSLRGDLDRIVMMALRKEPERRYGSVEMMATDLSRFLDGRPVSAQRDTWHYRASKFMQRNRAPVGVLSLIAAMLMGGIGGIIWQANIADKERSRGQREADEARKQSARAEQQTRLLAAERDRAESRLADVRALANSLLFDLPAAIRDLPGSTEGQRLLSSKAVEYYEKLVRDSGGKDPKLLAELATAYEQQGRLQGGSSFTSLGDTAAACASQQKALQIRSALPLDDPNNLKALGNTFLNLAELRPELGYGAKAEELFSKMGSAGLEGLASARQLRAASMTDLASALVVLHSATAIRKQIGLPVPIAEAQEREAELLEQLGRFRESSDLAREDEPIFEQASVAAPNDIRIQVDQIANRRRLARIAERSGDLEGAISNYRSALTAQTQLAARDPQNMRLAKDTLPLLLNLASALLTAGRLNESFDEYRHAATSAGALLKKDPSNPDLKAAQASADWGSGQVQLEQGHLTEASQTLIDAQKHGQGLTLALATLALGRIEREQSHLDQAAAHFRSAIRILETLPSQDFRVAANRAAAHNRLGEVLRLTGHPMDAKAQYDLAVAGLPGSASWAASYLAEAYSGLGKLAESDAEWKTAAAAYDKAAQLDGSRKDPRALADLADSRYHGCVARAGLKEFQQALESCDAAVRIWRGLTSVPHSALAYGLEKTADMQEALGNVPAACGLLSESLGQWNLTSAGATPAARERVEQRVRACGSRR